MGLLDSPANFCASLAATVCCFWLCAEVTRPRERIVVVQQPTASAVGGVGGADGAVGGALTEAEQATLMASNGADLPLIGLTLERV